MVGEQEPEPESEPKPEMVDVVDENDRVLRLVTRAEMRRERLRHRAVFIAILDGSGGLLVHRRATTKDIWPGWLDIAVGGVVTSGESFESAARRELAEEIGVEGVDPMPIDGGRIGVYDDAEVSLVGRCFQVVTSGPFTFSDGEVSSAWWMTRSEFDEARRRERFLPDSLHLLLPLLAEW